jgi:hypothetical protein
MSTFGREGKQGATTFEDVLDAFVEQGSVFRVLVPVGRHFDRSQMPDKLFGVSYLKVRRVSNWLRG